jgi:hypothetical protein
MCGLLIDWAWCGVMCGRLGCAILRTKSVLRKFPLPVFPFFLLFLFPSSACLLLILFSSFFPPSGFFKEAFCGTMAIEIGLSDPVLDFERKPFSCDVYSNVFTSSGDLNGHRWIRTGEKPYSRATCATRPSRQRLEYACNVRKIRRSPCVFCGVWSGHRSS